MEYLVKKIKIKDWQEYEKGIILFENEHYLLTAYMPVDYIVDGYRLYRKEFVENLITDEETEFNQKVVRHRSPKLDLHSNLELPFRSLAQNLISTHKVIELIYDGNTSFYVSRIGDQKYDINFLDPYGSEFSMIPPDFSEIDYCKALGFKSDYLDALLFLKKGVN